MSRGSGGVRSKMCDCPICGERYRRTNFMYRYTLNGQVVSSQMRYDYPQNNYQRTDTHILACKRKQLSI